MFGKKPGAPSGPLTVEEIVTYPAFREIRFEWNHLANAEGLNSVFLRHEWFDAVWQWLPPGCHPLLLIFREGGQLVGLCPLARQPLKKSGKTLTSLQFLRVPDTQECAVLTKPGRSEAVFEALASWLLANRKRWTLLSLLDLPAQTGIRDRLLNALVRAGIPTEPIADRRNLLVDLRQSWESYYRGLSRRLKKGNNYARNRLIGTHQVNIHWERGQTHTRQVLNKAIGISARSWKAALGVSLDNPGPRAFIERLSEHATGAGWLSLWLLEVDGKPAAMEYQLVYGGRVHALRADFDPAYQDLSPGSYLHHHQLKTLFEEPAMDTYLMGQGANPYKLRWSTEGSTLQGLQAWSPSLAGQLLEIWGRHIRPLASRVVGRIRKGKQGQVQ
jgi:hypothetical protein